MGVDAQSRRDRRPRRDRRQADARRRRGRSAPQPGRACSFSRPRRAATNRLELAMRPAPLQIGSIEIWPPLILAPMSGVTNRTMRALYRPFGLGLTVTEFVSSNALAYGSRRTMEMIDQHGLEKPVSTQLWGDDPATMALAAKVVRECGADIVDINFGCPAPKVTKTNGGSACLRDPDRCEAIMRAVVAAVDCPVTMKMRLGWSEDALVYRRRRAARAATPACRRSRCTRAPRSSSTRARPIGSTSRGSSAASTFPVIGNGDLDDPHVAMRAHARKRRRRDHARARDARQSVAHRADSRPDGGTRGARRCPPPADRLRFAHRALSRDGRRARRGARGSADAQAPRALSQGHSGRGDRCANASCASIRAADDDRRRSKRRSRGSNRARRSPHRR